jgi:hypothetical protein
VLKAGTRLESQVCETQVVIVRAVEGIEHLRAGGAPMIAIGAERNSGLELDPTMAQGNSMGKRYVDGTGIEVLVTRSGSGTLAIGDTALTVKAATPLPASD